MLAGTRKLFPTEYENFKEAMLTAAEEDELPVALQLDEIKNFTLQDFQEAFYEFHVDTGLDITGTMFICPDCGRLHVLVEVNYPDEDENSILQ